MPPIVAVVQRREPQRTERKGSGFNGRLPEGVYVSEVQNPVRYTDYNDVGKPVEHARSSQVIAVFTNVRSTLSIMREAFTTPLYGKSPQAAMPKGRQSVYQERININRTPAIAYGSLFSLESAQRPLGY